MKPPKGWRWLHPTQEPKVGDIYFYRIYEVTETGAKKLDSFRYIRRITRKHKGK